MTLNARTTGMAGWRVPLWVLVPIGCTLLALFFASGGVDLTNALVQWYVWGALAWPIVWVDRRLPIRRDALGLRAALHLPLSVAWTIVFMILSGAVMVVLNGQPLLSTGWLTMTLTRAPRGGIQWNIIYYWLIVGGHFAIDAHRQWRERERRATELERLLVESQLSALRAQLRPHFLFNALNTISAEVERQPKVARRMLEHLGELLRLSLESARPDRVALTDELQMLDHYLAIQRTRFAGRLDVRLAIDPATRVALVPGLLLQPLVENAIRHGIAPRVQPGRLRVGAVRADGPAGPRLTLTVEDDGVGLPAGWTLEAPAGGGAGAGAGNGAETGGGGGSAAGTGAGIGLTNTRRRLEAQYGTNHEFAVRPLASGGVSVVVTIPFETAARAASPVPGAARAEGEPERAGAGTGVLTDAVANADRR